jgi:XTP/dITP diphosphohydrolase
MSSREGRAVATIVLASNNVKKAHEMRSLLPVELDVMTTGQAGVTLPEETGDTFEDNALLKARDAAKQAGMVAVADDSGLVVDALDGRPGVRSARFAEDHGRASSDDENNRLLLQLLETAPPEARTARFVSVVAVVSPSGDEHVFHGVVEGRVGHHLRGERGFGYDPLFYPNGIDRPMAEHAPDEKNRISHRGKAFRLAAPEIVAMCLGRKANAY